MMSAARRFQALDEFTQLSLEEQRRSLGDLLSSPYRDVREGVLEILSSERLKQEPEWLEAIAHEISKDPVADPRRAVGLLALLARYDHGLDRNFIEFGERCLSTDDSDLQYQALVFLETQNVVGDSYVEAVKRLLESDDLEVRIVAIQAVERLAPSWALNKLESLAESAHGLEAFQILLVRLKLGDADLRARLEPELRLKLFDGRFCYPAIQALKQYGSDQCVDSLMHIAKSFFEEPTIRVAAAEAAAFHGSHAAIELLRKFAKKRHGNPEYAKQALGQFE